MKAAIYARISAEDSRDAESSVQRQIELAKAYAARKGWSVSDDHVYVDNGISGAEFVDRPGFARMFAAVPKRGKAPFDVLVMSELSRLGRDAYRVPFFVGELADAGIAIWTYLNDAQVTSDTPEARLMTSVKSYSDEAYRIRTAERVRSALVRKAEKGYAVGGRIFGYFNHEVTGPSGERSHVEMKIDEAEANTIRSIFTAYRDGHGHGSIAKAMNGDPRYVDLSAKYFGGQRVPGPRQGAGSWAASTVREILHRERYIGRISYGRVSNHVVRGTKRRKQGSNVVTAECPELRIISQPLWDEVQSRLAETKKAYVASTGGKVWGGSGRGTESRYLLSGLGVCYSCGANIVASGGVPSSAHRKAFYYYSCSQHQNKGSTVCANHLRARMDWADGAVKDAVRETLLTPAGIERVVALAEAQINAERVDRPALIARYEADLQQAKRQRDNLIAAIAAGNAPASLVDAIGKLDAKIIDLEAQIAQHRKDLPRELDRARLKRDLRGRLTEFNARLDADIPSGRQVLRELLDRSILFDSSSGQYVLSGRVKPDALFSNAYIGVVPRKGLEPPQCCHR